MPRNKPAPDEDDDDIENQEEEIDDEEEDLGYSEADYDPITDPEDYEEGYTLL